MTPELFVPLFGLPVGPEILLIVLIAILLFGANKIPELARSTGEAMGEFQKGREEVEQELEEMQDTATGDFDTGSSADTTAASDVGAEADDAGISEAEPADGDQTDT